MRTKKKLKTDPEPSEINPEILRIAERNGFLRQPLNLYLAGQLSWRETLEMMVMCLHSDYRDKTILLNKYIQRKTGIPNPPKLPALCPKQPKTIDVEDVQVVS